MVFLKYFVPKPVNQVFKTKKKSKYLLKSKMSENMLIYAKSYFNI